MRMVLQVWEEYDEEEKAELQKELTAWKQQYLQSTQKRKSVSTASFGICVTPSLQIKTSSQITTHFQIT